MAPSHELAQFVRQATEEIAAEYQGIYARTREDPGTAGDQGEENWAELLRRWLPSTHHVVTKGRILGSDGHTSPQVDVLVLSPYYPRGLINKKLYLAAGVLAAFECKTTLRPSHIRRAVETAVSISQLGRVDGALIRYGLLAHSAHVPDKQTAAEQTVTRLLRKADHDLVGDIRDSMDYVCVADLGAWVMMQTMVHADGLFPTHAISAYLEPRVNHSYVDKDAEESTPEPIGRFLTCFLKHLAERDTGLQPFAAYFASAGLYGAGSLQPRRWVLEDTPANERALIAQLEASRVPGKGSSSVYRLPPPPD
ncbi:MAG: hypothetical protein HOV67_07510 [Kribbellaceae bacterium]|nr:hypothetical protein [Kribbellaceae bacterium]